MTWNTTAMITGKSTINRYIKIIRHEQKAEKSACIADEEPREQSSRPEPAAPLPVEWKLVLWAWGGAWPTAAMLHQAFHLYGPYGRNLMMLFIMPLIDRAIYQRREIAYPYIPSVVLMWRDIDWNHLVSGDSHFISWAHDNSLFQTSYLISNEKK